MTEAHVRIDEGVKRGPRRKPSDVERQARNEAGKFLTRYSPETKQKAVDQALTAIECGARVDDIADKHNIPRSTLYSWLVGTDAAKLRTQFFDGQTMRNLVEIRAAETPLDLARAREELSGWLKVAAVRDPSSFGPKQHVTVEHTGDLGERLRRARERVIEGESVQIADCAAQQSGA